MSRRRAHGVIVLAGALISCCSRSDFGRHDVTVAVSEATTWGDFVATLDAPDCPSDLVLTVDTTAEELDGGETVASVANAGARLSFAEAMWINANGGGGGTILFDAATFPASTPGVIPLSGAIPLPNLAVPGTAVCIDARRRGVILRWPDWNTSCDGQCIWTLGPGSLVVGLTLLYPPSAAYVESRVIGCRIGTDGHETFLGPIVFSAHVYGGTFGPGNAVSTSSGWGLSLRGDGTRVVGNSFGFDPLTGTALRPVNEFILNPQQADERFHFEGNTFGGQPTEISGQSILDTVLVAQGNFFGVGADGEPLPSFPDGSRPDGLAVLGAVSATVGPNNTIRGVAHGVLIGAPAVHLTRNIITGNDLAIGPSGAISNLPAAPEVTRASAGVVLGMCAGAGEVEVFADPGNQGETFLGTAACDPVAPYPFSLSTALPSGRFVTALYTDATGQSSPFSLPRAIPYEP